MSEFKDLTGVSGLRRSVLADVLLSLSNRSGISLFLTSLIQTEISMQLLDVRTFYRDIHGPQRMYPDDWCTSDSSVSNTVRSG